MPDLFQMKPKNTTLEIVVPGTDRKVGLKLELRPLSSDECLAAHEANHEEAEAYRLARPDEVKMYRIEHGDDAELPIPREMRARHNRRLYASAIVSWEWHSGLTWKGAVPELTPENAEDVLTNSEVYIQVIRHTGDRSDPFAHFAASLPATSATASDTSLPAQMG